MLLFNFCVTKRDKWKTWKESSYGSAKVTSKSQMPAASPTSPRAAGTAGFPMCQTHVPGGLQHGHFPSLVATASWETVIPFCCSIFWGGVTAIQGSFSKDNNNSLPVFQLQLTKACKRFTGEKCCQSTKVLVLFTKKKKKGTFTTFRCSFCLQEENRELHLELWNGAEQWFHSDTATVPGTGRGAPGGVTAPGLLQGAECSDD